VRRQEGDGMGLGAWLKGLFGSRQRPPCRGELVARKGALRGSMCEHRGRYYPATEERAERRAMFRQWRRLLRVAADLHTLRYEWTRIVPFIVDAAGGGDWHCIIAPAAMISRSHGATIDERIDWWGGAEPPGRGFPYLIGRGVRGLPGLPHGLDSTANLLQAYPKLAGHCLGSDREYAEWY